MNKAIIRRDKIRDKTGYCYHWVVKLEKRGEFPKRVRLGPNSVGWIESEIDDWLAKRQRVAA
jgi:prophage regulatory protein